MAKKYVVTGEHISAGIKHKFFIFGDAEEVGDYVVLTILEPYIYYDGKLITSIAFDKFKNNCIMINKVSKKGIMYSPDKSRETVEIEVENSNNIFSMVEMTTEAFNFMKETK